MTIARANIHERCFVTAGDGTFKLWRISTKDRRIHGVDVKVGKIKRTINCLIIDEKDQHVYGGTTSGDIIKARLHTQCPDDSFVAHFSLLYRKHASPTG